MIGMLFTMLVEMVLVSTSEIGFTMGERIITILFWPIMLVYMIYEFMK